MDMLGSGQITFKLINNISEKIGKNSNIIINGKNIFIYVNKKMLRDIISILINYNAIPITMVAYDKSFDLGKFQLYYIFFLNKEKYFIILIVEINYNDLKVSSVADLIKGFDWHEREIHDLMGIEFEGRVTPRLILPNEYPHGIYPLRKEFSENFKILLQKNIDNYKETGAEKIMIVPIGPYHPELLEPIRFELCLKNDVVVDVYHEGFMAHRGIEKISERLNYDKVSFLAERICGICGFCHSVCYCQAVEDACMIEVPERARFIRSILLEVERLESHFLWLADFFHLCGYDKGFLEIFKIREKIMILAELLSGSRKTYGLNLPGGVRKDLNPDKVKKFLEIINEVEEEYKKIIVESLARPEIDLLKGSGILPYSEANSYPVVGPVARASGINRDVRKDDPYAAYQNVSFKVPIYTEGDNMARMMVRIEEIYESINMLKYFLDNVPQGPIMAENWEWVPNKISIKRVEAPRGENVHFISTGITKLDRWKVRAPTYANIQALPVMLKGENIKNALLTIMSIDPCIACTERVTILNFTGNGFKVSTIPFDALTRRG
jgi:Ni,Fe-hydrogenase III large subunit/Ni,Fe-hydrogenase III component G